MSRKRQIASRDADPIVLRALACRYADGHVLAMHQHAWGQLLFAREGVMEVETGGRSFVVPPSRALWIGRELPHAVRMNGSVAMRTLYVAEPLVRTMPAALHAVTVLHVPPLLRELVLHVSDRGPLDSRVPHDARLAALIVDLLEVAQEPPTKLTWPVDPRARRVAERLDADPSQEHAVADLARVAGASERTLARLFLQQTGLTIGQFRRDLRLRHAVRLLANGAKVTSVALDVGYDSTSAFVTTFRRAFGVTPGEMFRS